MAMSPAEVEAKLKDSQKDRLEQLEQSIDASLLKGTRTFALTKFGGRDLADTLADRYRLAGWNVAVTYDQRDGDYVFLSPRRKTG